LGQHFLVDEATLAAVMQAAAVEPTETVVEIGGGVGALTQARRAQTVHCLEIDETLVAVLHQALADLPNVTIHHADALKFPYETISEPYSIVANIPYQITAPLVDRFIAERARLRRVTLTVQLEVAQRLCADAGSKDYGVLSVVVSFYFEAHLHAKVPAQAFWPPPKVGSAVLTLSPRAAPPVDVGDDVEAFLRLVRQAFAQRRKTLRNNLKALRAVGWSSDAVEEALRAAGVDGRRRAETLTLEEFAALWRALEAVR
jgi:16S rRNA (adenine1518-N6/adenine1519-N6)-dimethyltransferase